MRREYPHSRDAVIARRISAAAAGTGKPTGGIAWSTRLEALGPPEPPTEHEREFVAGFAAEWVDREAGGDEAVLADLVSCLGLGGESR